VSDRPAASSPPSEAPATPAPSDDVRALLEKVLANQRASAELRDKERDDTNQKRAADLKWQERIEGRIRTMQESIDGHDKAIAEHQNAHTDLRDEHEALEQDTSQKIERARMESDGAGIAVHSELANVKGSLRDQVAALEAKIDALKEPEGQLSTAVKTAVKETISDRRVADAFRYFLVVVMTVAGGALSARYVLPPAPSNSPGVLLPGPTPSSIALSPDGGLPVVIVVHDGGLPP